MAASWVAVGGSNPVTCEQIGLKRNHVRLENGRRGAPDCRYAPPLTGLRYAQLEPTALSVLAMLLPALCTFCPWALACS